MNDPLNKNSGLREDEDPPPEGGDGKNLPLEPEVMDDDSDETEAEEAARPLPVLRGSDALAPLDPLTAYLNEIRNYAALSEEGPLDMRY